MAGKRTILQMWATSLIDKERTLLDQIDFENQLLQSSLHFYHFQVKQEVQTMQIWKRKHRLNKKLKHNL